MLPAANARKTQLVVVSLAEAEPHVVLFVPGMENAFGVDAKTAGNVQVGALDVLP